MTTRALAEFTASIRPDALPVEVRRQAARLVLDALGCAMAAWTEDAEKSRIARDIAALYPGAPCWPRWWQVMRLPCVSAWR